jgi:hypothetical protein
MAARRRSLFAIMVDLMGTESEGETVAGRYEVRSETILGVPVAALVWVVRGEPPMLLTTIAPERLPALAEALNRHVAGTHHPDTDV